jgi:phage nucleotide-binding protein
MKIINTGDPTIKPSVVMMIYGEGGVGKTTFASTAPSPIIADCENGAKYFGLRGIKVNVAQIEKWSDMREFLDYVKNEANKVETVVIDPLGELMEKLKKFMVATGDTKLVQKDGNPTMAGWGWLKKTFKDYLKVLRDSGKNVILIAHIEENKDEDRIVKRPKIETKISDDIVNMVDIVGYMTSIQSEGETKRIIIVDPGNDKFTAKDRTGQLGKVIEPDFSKIIGVCQGTASYSWSKKVEAKKEEKPVEKKEEKKVEEPVAEEKVEEEFIEEMPKVDNKAKINNAIDKLKNFKKE